MVNKTDIETLALEIGFDLCYFSRPISNSSWQEALEHYADTDMEYLKKNIEIRANPKAIWPQVKTIIVLGLNYYHPKQSELFSSYAYIDDYHDIVKKMLKTLAQKLGCEFRIYCDTAPVMEKQIAINSGLGWQGKNTLIISPKIGSCFFLGEIFIDQEITDINEAPVENLCKNCNLCQKACPTGALDNDYKLNVKKCLSYLSIEHKTEISPALASKMKKKIYGCDECLHACPWNKSAPICKFPIKDFIKTPLESFAKIDEEEFRKIFKKTSIKRIGYQRFMRNVNNALKN